jgi:tetratricopeptide (TPR) repeat protein
MATFEQPRQVVGTQYNAAGNMYIYAQATPRPVDPETLAMAERQLAALPLETIPDPAPLPPGSRMPLRRNPLFVGREADLRALASALKGGEALAIDRTAAILGLGGMGKTQLASEFVHRYGQCFAGGVYWLSFADPAAVPTEVAACGGPGALALHPEFHTLPLTDQVQLVQAAWQSPLPRLLVFDNCEDEALLVQWRPPHGGCRVLVTSRRAQWDVTLRVHTLPLGSLRRDESLTLLRHHRPDRAASDTDLETIAEEVGDLPLALHSAGSFLGRYQTITPTAYLAQLRQPDLLDHPSLQGWQLTRALSPTQHEQHVARTFALSYDRLDPVDATDASALALLARAVHFAPGQPIPRGLLLATINGRGNTPGVAVQTEDALGRLLNLGLLEPNAVGAIRLHRLLAVFVRAVAHDVGAQTAVEDALLAEAKRLCDAGYSGPLLSLYPHLRAVTEAAQPREDARTADLATALGDALYRIGDYAGAQPAWERALALRERTLGPDHPQVVESLNNLAAVYCYQGRYAEAEPLLQRALALGERTLGSDHLQVVESLNNLAVVHQAQGRYAEAEPLLQRALALGEPALGPNHPHVTGSLDSLAAVYLGQGRYAEAELLVQRALALQEQALGPDHPQVAGSLNYLANIYYYQAQRLWHIGPFSVDLACLLGIGLFVLVGVWVGQVFGPFHMVSIVTWLVGGLAGLGAMLYYGWLIIHSYAKAEPLFQRALALREQALGPQHFHVAESLNNLAAFYFSQRRKAEAKPLFQRAVAIWEQALGPQHPLVALTRKNYARSQPLWQQIHSWLLCKREPG